ncbi:phage tail tape measure protein [Haemophilus parainfluenzae]|jgi:phage tail tape measure protein, TP901 family|uniref:phage tail tape measure protein n=1 Tax=Haemophilus parainfluenzae TaxID=729 RepID=UPI000C9A3D5C|nr:phage tail tape measure protein [Haemophilus parainfluenzae]PMC56846.1 phage tail tape measure protein [Haemophilus parainfluenzae]DAK77924.1 MAG TPA: minor tail protein [Caudoviricetes sp.]
MSNKLAIGLVITAGVSGAIKGIRSVCSSFKILQDQSLSTTKKMGALAKTGLAGFSTLASSATAVMGSIRGLADPAIKFESAMADVRKVVDFDTPEQFKEMGNDILKLTRTIPMAGEEIAAIVAAGGQSGVARENLLGYAKDAATMGVAFDMAAGDAGEAMATMANVLGKPITEMAQFGDVINHLSDNANSKAKDIVNVITRVGSDTRMLGLSENQAAALGSTFLSMGKAPELAAQAVKGMSSAFLQLKAGAHEKELKQLGFTTKSFAAAMNKDAQGAISSFIEKVKKMPKDKQYPLLAKVFGKQYADDVLLLAQNTGEYNRQLSLLQETDANGNLKYIGSMQREFENRSNTTENKLTKLKNSLTEIAEKIGRAFLPVITSFVENITPVIYSITEWVETNPQLMEWVLTIGGGIGAVVGGLLTLHSAFSFVTAGLLPFLKLGKFLGGFLGNFLFSAISKLSLGFGYLIGYIAKGAMMFSKAIFMMSRALLTNPIGLLIAGIAVAAYLIYDNWGKIGPWFAELWQTVSGAFSSAWSSITNFCSEAWTNISNFFTSGIGNITATILDWSPLGLFQQVFSTVLSWFGIDVPSKFSDFGKNMIDGLVNGIKNAWESAKQIVSDLGDGIKGWFAEKLGIHSPSRVFKSYGVNVVEGLAIGMNKSIPMAEDASDNLSSAVGLNGVSHNTGLLTNYQPLNRAEVMSSATTQAQGITVHFNPTINVNGGDRNGVLNQVEQGLKMSLSEFEMMLKRVLDQQQRRAY